MAQAEDTELRDLVIETLERNGSLAKIRALLRANIFLAFEDDCENLKQNVNLDTILKHPEGKLALSIVHEFLEFCNLKNTLFVYMSESRQGNDYNYDGKKVLSEKLHISQCDNSQEPLLVSLIKNAFIPQKKYYEQNENDKIKKYEKCPDGNYRDEQNCTYIMHEDSQSSSTSNSDNSSSDEKNKLHLRLHLDNSDTDTSSDSARDKPCSVYIPGDHIIDLESKNENKIKLIPQNSGDYVDARNMNKLTAQQNKDNIKSTFMTEIKLSTNSSSESTSYIDLKPFNSLDEKMLNTTGLPISERKGEDVQANVQTIVNVQNQVQSKIDSDKSGTLSTISHISADKETKMDSSEKTSQASGKSVGDTAEYSLDFSSSPVSKNKDRAGKYEQSKGSAQDNIEKYLNITSPVQSPHQVSRSSQSSVSLSDVADLISEKSFMGHHTNDKSNSNKSNLSGSDHSKEKVDSKHNKFASDDSGDFTESPVPSLSNLSLDIHSD